MRSQQFRYIRYETGGEELYDHSVDPQEWRNLADDPRYVDTKQALSRWLPGAFAEPAPAKNAYQFDPLMYTWSVR